METKVGIIGAGISGLLACKYVREVGLTPVLFEAKSSVGGLWIDHTIQTTKLQSPRQAFQFSDFPWPDSVTQDFPDHNQVLEYLELYAHEFDLYRYIKFNHKVSTVEYQGLSEEDLFSWDLWGGIGEPFSSKGKWNVTVENMQTGTTEIHEVNFLIVCVGRFSGLPNIPNFPANKGPEVFDGKVMHSMDYSIAGADVIKGKRVAVIGIQKSALDIANECAMINGAEKPCTVIYRRTHWSFPDYTAWGVPLDLLVFTRFAEFMIHKPGEGLLLSLLATLLTPLRWLIWKFVESNLKWKLPLKKYNMVPEQSFHQDLSGCTLAITPDNFYDKVEQGSVILKKSKKFSFCKNGLILEGETAPLEVDVVIFATGYRGEQKLLDIFTSPTLQKYIKPSPTSSLPLYRETILPRIPQLAVIGYSETLVNLYALEMRCRWLVYLLKGSFKLPRIKEMEKNIEMWENYRKQYARDYHPRFCLSTLLVWFNDQICRDMGCNPRRKNRIWKELFESYGSMDYVGLRPPEN